jgi:hypothetical protein
MLAVGLASAQDNSTTTTAASTNTTAATVSATAASTTSTKSTKSTTSTTSKECDAQTTCESCQAASSACLWCSYGAGLASKCYNTNTCPSNPNAAPIASPIKPNMFKCSASHVAAAAGAVLLALISML